LSLYAGLAWACVFLFVGAIAHVFEVTYGFSQGQAGTVLICGFIGAAISYILHLTIQEPLYRRRTIAGHGKAAPEVRLYPAAIGGILFAAGCFGFAWTARPHIHWIVPCIFICMFNIGIYSIYLGTYLMISECYDRYSSSGVRLTFRMLACRTMLTVFPPTASGTVSAPKHPRKCFPFLRNRYGPSPIRFPPASPPTILLLD
jgi:hypothetical protein